MYYDYTTDVTPAGKNIYRVCSLTIESVLLYYDYTTDVTPAGKNIYRMCSLTIESVLLL